MRADDHAAVRRDLSARLDGEVSPTTAAMVDDHLESCAECRAHLARIESIRAVMRVQPLPDDVPDLAPAVMRSVRVSGDRHRARSAWSERIRIASVAAAAAALVLFGATFPFGDDPLNVASADAITDEVRSAARELDAYRARFEIIERGWHADVGTRRFEAEVTFKAPESLHLVMTDETAYPSPEWPTNDYELTTNPDRWWIEEHSSCPTQGLPSCAAPTTWAGVIERRSVFNRQPFDGTTPLPTDIVVPLETFASDGTFTVLGPDRVLDRPTIRVRSDYRNARPLVESLQVGGAWRPFHPLDQVDVWLDRATWFPLRVEVTEAGSTDRAAWAQRFGIVEPDSGRLFAVRTRSFEQPSMLPNVRFNAPQGGLARDGGFQAAALPARATPVDVPRGFELYRSGRAGAQRVRAYTDGMAYLKVVMQARNNTSAPLTAEEVRVGSNWAYYRPASLQSGREIDLFGRTSHIHMESNLPRSDLLQIAASARVAAQRLPREISRPGSVTITRLSPAQATSVDQPEHLPAGYRMAVALHTDMDATETVTVYYRRAEAEFEGDGIRVVQTTPMRLLPPSSEEFLNVRVGDFTARWSVERGELEWLDGTIYRAVAVPSGDLTTAVLIAQSL